MKKLSALFLMLISAVSFAQTTAQIPAPSVAQAPSNVAQTDAEPKADAAPASATAVTPTSASTNKKTATTATSTARAPQSAQISSEALVSKATNPLTPLSVFVIQNYLQTGLGAGNSVGDEMIARYVQHIPANKIIPIQQLFRVQVPISVVPAPNGQSVQTGLGGANLFDAFLVSLTKRFEIGLGPAVTLPTSTFSTPFSGSNVTQGGASLVTVYRTPKLTLSTSTQAETAFKWDNGKPNIATISFEPIFLYTIYGTWYIRSTATWTFTYLPGGHGQYNIPIGLGLGKVWKSKSLIYNFYIEPQPTIARGGTQSQNFELLAGMNIMFN